MARLSAIVPIRNRSGTRLRNCLTSLRWQNIGPEDLEIVLSDFGSEPTHAASVKELAKKFDARVIRTDEFGDWNRSRALNLGIQGATAPYVLNTDADMVFEPNFVQTILDTHERTDGRALVVCACDDLPREVPEQPWTVEEYEWLRSNGRRRRSPGTGACQSATRAFFNFARGYDERFVHWGSEDTDMRDRALKYGLQLTWISDKTSMCHQWHPSSRHKRLIQNRKNALIHFFSRGQVVKNPTGWGNLP